MAHRVTSDKQQATPAKPKLYNPSLPAGGHRLGELGLPNLAAFSPERTYTPNSDAYDAGVGGKPVTVGEYMRLQREARVNAIGNVLHGIVELAPPVLIGEMLMIKAKHGIEAHERIYDLPWDPQGRWMTRAEKIRAQEAAEASAEIRNLPLPRAARATGTAIVDGATTAGRAVGTAWNAVGDYASSATLEAIHASRETGKGFMRGILASIATTGQGMVNWAREHKSAFQ
ncbi:MAG: hypothetical protein FJZ00_02240 [Candidatus Sericytochromatia bacterium]|uniref:Uncharacterized protein n=1 Tax=Candidatus Tanganyikabacteria bacterium TaxID=2961651 RepID=A0A937X4C9_9BACT|nr:hypothetical protein [Candidatus Tanganyikabacteria bacterium]